MSEEFKTLEPLLELAGAFTRALNEGYPSDDIPEHKLTDGPEANLTTYVVDRRGKKRPVLFDKITARNEDLRSNPAYGPVLRAIDSPGITTEVVRRFRNGMTTRELDAETAAICTQLATTHIDNEKLATRIYISDLHKRTPQSLMKMLDAIIEEAPNRESIRLSNEFVTCVRRAEDQISNRIAVNRDSRLRFFGYQTISRSYLLRPTSRREESSLLDDQLMERPQHLYMRIAIGTFVCQEDGLGHLALNEIFQKRLNEAFKFYDALSLQLVSNATPTMLNTATKVPQLSSCFQIATGDDLPTLFDTVKSAALISKWSGGISLWIHGVRAEGSPIRKTGGRSTGVKRYVKILNEVQLYVNQGGNRPGAFAIYLGVDHDDIFTFLAMARLKGEEALKSLSAPDLKYAVWVSDLFMKALVAQIENDAHVAAGGVDDPTAGDWYTFSPDEAPGLHLVYGREYEKLYNQYVAEGRYRRKVKAGDIMAAMFKTWAQIGIPYVLFKDAINLKSNMKNVAQICSSNLCCEITIPSWSNFDAEEFNRFHPGNKYGEDDNGNLTGGEFGVCNLAAICLESFVVTSGGKPSLDFAGIAAAAALETRVLNKVIDHNHYPSEECRRSNRRHRPIGIGIMGLADVLARLKIVYGSRAAAKLARGIAATVYFGAMSESARIAEIDGSYETFPGSPVSKGVLQPDLWEANEDLETNWWDEVREATDGVITQTHWDGLRTRVKRGIRNAYVTAYMPTATTSNIAGQNECFEPFTSNLYTRKTLAGEFTIVNKHLMAELTELGIWDDQMRRDMLVSSGSIQGIKRIPEEVQKRYRTAREIHPKMIIRMAKAMAPFICQSMSMNLYLTEPSLPKILSFLVAGWREGLKTGSYYIHMQPASGGQKTAARAVEAAPVEKEPQSSAEAAAEAALVCSRENPGDCAACAL